MVLAWPRAAPTAPGPLLSTDKVSRPLVARQAYDPPMSERSELHLMGAAEVAAFLRVSRQRVNQLVQQAGFPAPVAHLEAGRIWVREDIETWAASRGR